MYDPSKNNISPRLRALTDSLIHETIDAAGMAELEALLLEDAAAQDYFAAECHLHTLLALSAAADRSVDMAQANFTVLPEEHSTESKGLITNRSTTLPKESPMRFPNMKRQPLRFAATSLALLILCSFSVYGIMQCWQKSQSQVARWLGLTKTEHAQAPEGEEEEISEEVIEYLVEDPVFIDLFNEEGESIGYVSGVGMLADSDRPNSLDDVEFFTASLNPKGFEILERVQEYYGASGSGQGISAIGSASSASPFFFHIMDMDNGEIEPFEGEMSSVIEQSQTLHGQGDGPPAFTFHLGIDRDENSSLFQMGGGRGAEFGSANEGYGFGAAVSPGQPSEGMPGEQGESRITNMTRGNSQSNEIDGLFDEMEMMKSELAYEERSGGEIVDQVFPATDLVLNIDGEISDAEKIIASLNHYGKGPGEGGDQYDYLPENRFRQADINPLSTFSIDVDTASYSKVRMYLNQYGQAPPPSAIRLEEMINYFCYDYPEPDGDHPVAPHVEIASCPWESDHRLVRVGIQARNIDLENRPPSNLVFLLDVSGSMSDANKLPLVKAGFQRFVQELRPEDRVAIVVYASASGLVLPSTPGDEQETILAALDLLKAEGSTNGGEGITLAYQVAQDNFIENGVNRIILCTDGDFNVGETATGGLVELAAEKAEEGVYLSILGFGMGNHNDAMLESVSNNAEGNYAFIDTLREANKVLVEQMGETLVTVARDVKLQIEFNPGVVKAYRLIGYENRILAEEDFNNDEIDAGEIGAGHTVTALYEVVSFGIDDTLETPPVAPLRYQQPLAPVVEEAASEMLTVNLRYKLPDAEESTLIDLHATDEGLFFNQASREFQFAAAVAEFGLILRHSDYAPEANLAEVLELATDNIGPDAFGYRAEFVELVNQTTAIAQQQKEAAAQWIANQLRLAEQRAAAQRQYEAEREAAAQQAEQEAQEALEEGEPLEEAGQE